MKKFFFATTITSLISFVICIASLNRIHEALLLVVIYPILYFICSFFLYPMLKDETKGGRITVTIFLVLQWIRNVLFPAIAAVSGYFNTVSDIADESSAKRAAVLCLIELVVTTAFCAALLKFSKKKSVEDDSSSFRLSGNYWVYLIFVIAMFVIFLLYGRDMFTFLRLSADVSSRASLSDRNLILQALIEYGMTVFMIIFLFFCYRKYQQTDKKNYIWVALAVSIIRIGIISTESESRMAILYSVGVLLYLMPCIFPSERKRIFKYIVISGFVVIGLMTVYKTFKVFQYDSYLSAVISESSDFGSNEVAYTLDSYFYGVKDVARNIHISKLAGLSYKNMVADIVQNTFGLKYLLPSTGNTTIGAYNYFIYSGSRISGHLYSAIAYGDSYFGFVFAPLAPCLNIFVTFIFEGLLIRHPRRLDIIYINCMIFVRSAATMFSCFPMCWNYLTRTLIIGAAIIGGASLFANRTGTSRAAINTKENASTSAFIRKAK